MKCLSCFDNIFDNMNKLNYSLSTYIKIKTQIIYSYLLYNIFLKYNKISYYTNIK